MGSPHRHRAGPNSGRRGRIAIAAGAFCLALAGAVPAARATPTPVGSTTGAATTGAPTPTASTTTLSQIRQFVRSHLRNRPGLSQGARAWLLGPQSGGPSSGAGRAARVTRVAFGSNVDAASPAEDVAAGQSETAIAAQASPAGQREVMVAWNDASGFLYSYSPTSPKGSLTGVGFSSNGGRSFTDLVGLPNDNLVEQWSGDPTVVSLDDGSHFIVGSLYLPSVDACYQGRSTQAEVAISVATVGRDGRSVRLGEPVVVATGGNLCPQRLHSSVSFLDKDFLAYDPRTRTLALTYTRFYLLQDGLGQVEAVRVSVPSKPASLSPADVRGPMVVWHQEPICRPGVPSSEENRCGAENEGAYPAVDPNGGIYVAWERNYMTNLEDGDPYVYLHAAYIPPGATTPAVGGNRDPFVVSQGQPNGSPDHLGVKSLDSEVIAGYNRGPGNDFPRIAVDAGLRRVILVWNDADLHPLGDIWMRSASYGLSHLYPTARVDNDHSYALHFLPSLTVERDGTICTGWYDRRLWGPDSALTDYFGECRPNPSRQEPDFRITTGPSDWTDTSTMTVPNFGDYTDASSLGDTAYYAWSDGRIGVPQPFVDHHG
jgi:hypothetical protein